MFPRHFIGLEGVTLGVDAGTNRIHENRIAPRLEIAAGREVGRIDRTWLAAFPACQLRAVTIVASADTDKIFTILGCYPNGHHGRTLIVGDHIRRNNGWAK